jgi:ribonuclease HI
MEIIAKRPVLFSINLEIPSTSTDPFSPHHRNQSHFIPHPHHPTKNLESQNYAPLLKTFAWRLFRQALPTAERVSRFAPHIDKHCTSCGLIENDSHLFFLCNLPHHVWDHSARPPIAHLIDPQVDGIQHILPHLLPQNTTENNMTQILLILWYIWKARNDQRFQRKVWTFMRVLHAAHSHFTTNSLAWGNDGHNTISPLLQTSPPPHFQGYRCYVDAATTPDSHNHSINSAGLGIFIVNTDVNPPFSVFIKAFMQDSTSVLMAESAALALAASVCRSMNLEQLQFYSDSQLLVDCLNGHDPSNPPDWRIKPFTRIIQQSLNTSYKVYKIPRAHNMMADSLARRALHNLLSFQPSSPFTCTNPDHCQGCPVTNALQLVTINSVMVLAASCC